VILVKILIAPNSFKGSLSAMDAAERIAVGLRASGLRADLQLFPLADGGDGTVEAFLAGGGTLHQADTVDALGRPIRAVWGMLPDGETAVIEMAKASGLALLNPDEVTPESSLHASTYGTGILILQAINTGAKRIILGLGGSATTDGGMGCLRALGVRFVDVDGNVLEKGGGALIRLAHVDHSSLHSRLPDVEIIIASDVTNPAIGDHGAARVFAPQKGADAAAVAQLESGLTRLCDVIEREIAADVRTIPGGGAAGAFAAGMMAFTKARIRSGIELLLDFGGFDAACTDATLVITGEGQIDSQTLGGKAPFGVAQRAAAFGVPTVALVGGLRADDKALHEAGIAAALPIVTHPMRLDEAIAHAAELIERAAMRLGYLLQVGRGLV